MIGRMRAAPQSWEGNRMLRLAACLCALVGAAVGALGLAGWIFGIPVLKSVLPGAVEIKPNAAVGLMCAAAGLMLIARRPGSRLGAASGLTIAALGLATLGQYAFGWQLGIDEALFRDTGTAYNPARGRMSPYTAAALVALGIGLAAQPRSWAGVLVWPASTLVVLIGAVSLVGYIWNARELVTDRVIPPVAIHTALALIALGAGVLLARLVHTETMEKDRRLYRVEGRVLTGLAGAVLVLLLGAGSFYRSSAASAEWTEWLAHSRRVDHTLRNLYAAALDALSAHRGYLLTSAKPYRDTYVERAYDARRSLEALHVLLPKDGPQALVARELEVLLSGRHEELWRVIALHDGGDVARAQALVRDGDGREIANAMLAAIQKIDQLESASLDQRRSDMERSRQRTLVGLLVLLSGAVWVGIVLFRGARAEMVARRQVEQDLEKAYAAALMKNQALKKSQEEADARASETLLANRFLDSVIENLPNVVFVKDAHDLRYVRLNRAGHALLGLQPGQLVGKLDADFFPREQADALVAQDREVLARGALLDIPKQTIWTASGASRILHTRKIPILDEANRPRYLLGISEDITEEEDKKQEILRLNVELQQRAEEANSANRAKGTFLATMSHEIRTPMNGMLGMLEILSMTRLDRGQQEAVQTIVESGKSLLQIIGDVLDFSKMEAGKLDVHPHPTSLRQLVEHIHAVHLGTASRKRLLVRRHVDPRISPALMVDPLRLRQVLTNFVSNALKFTSAGSIDIEAALLERSDEAETIRFTVTDTGAGISAEDQSRLFEPFHQGSGDLPRRAGGTGLGLTICRRLAEVMGGTVDLASELGKGTRISLTLRLPVADPAHLEQAGPDTGAAMELLPFVDSVPSAAAAEAAGTLVLVVDDHPTNRLLLSRQLQVLGLATETASDGVQALELWSLRRFGLLITDCQMPHMDGYELTGRIRQLEAGSGQRVPIIACTANAMKGEAEVCLAAGMDDYIAKPIELSVLRKKLVQWLPAAIPSRPFAPEPLVRRPLPPSAIDLSVIAATWGDDIGAAREILAAFRQANDRDVEVLRQAANAASMADILQAAHRMRGAGKMVGANDFALACEKVEAAARAGDLPGVEGAMLGLESELSRLNATLEVAARLPG